MDKTNFEYVTPRSILVYILKHYKSLIAGLIIGAVLLVALCFFIGEISGNSVEEENTTADEDLEEAKENLNIAEENLENLQYQLQMQEDILEEYENELKKYEESWEEDIYIQTSASDRSAIDTVYQINGDETSAGQLTNLIFATSTNMYQEIAEQLNDGKTAYNIQCLFSVEADLDLYQIVVSVSDESSAGVREMQELSRRWIEDQCTEYMQNHPNTELNLEVSEGDVYTYFDTDIFSTQRTAEEKKISLNNSINTERNSITTTKNNILTKEKEVEEYEEKVESLEKSEKNSVSLGRASIGIRNIILFAFLGAIIGVVVVAVIYIFCFLFSKRLRDPEDMESRTGQNLLGSLWQPPYRPGKDRWKRKLDRWNGVQYDLNSEEQMNQLLFAIRLKIQRNGYTRAVLTGSCDASDIECVYQEVTKSLPTDVSQKLAWGDNPTWNLETEKKLLDADAVILVEKIGKSEIKNIRELRMYLKNNEIQVIGGIAT